MLVGIFFSSRKLKRGSMGVQDYSFLRDLRVEFQNYEVTNRFSLCFWFYLNDASTLPSTILHQEYPDVTSHAPFLLLDEKKKILLFPALISSHLNVTCWREVAHATSECEFPTKKWVHVGCEVTQDLLHLYFDGKIVGEKSLTSSLNNDTGSDNSRISLTCISGKDSQLDGYVHSSELFPVVSTMKNHYVTDPPVQLCIDSSSAYEIEEDSDGVWSIVGGKAVKACYITSNPHDSKSLIDIRMSLTTIEDSRSAMVYFDILPAIKAYFRISCNASSSRFSSFVLQR